MAEKWYIDTIKNSSLRKLLDYDAQEIISWIDHLIVQYDEEFVDTLDDIIFLNLVKIRRLRWSRKSLSLN